MIVPPVTSTFALQMTDLVETAGIEPAPRSPRVSEGFAGKNRRCFYCGVHDRVEMDHFPIPMRHGGTEMVPACHPCHTLKDRKRAGWLEPTAIYEGTKHLSRRSSDGMPLVVCLLDRDAERWVAGEAAGNWPTHDDLEHIATWVGATVERCTTTHARLFVAWFFGQYLDVIDDVLKTFSLATYDSTAFAAKTYAEGDLRPVKQRKGA